MRTDPFSAWHHLSFEHIVSYSSGKLVAKLKNGSAKKLIGSADAVSARH